MRKSTGINGIVSAKRKVSVKSRKKTVAANSTKRSGKENRMVRIDARIPSDVKKIVQYAASIQGRSQTDFMVTAINEAAQRVIAENTVIQLCLADQITLAEALDNDCVDVNDKRFDRLKRAIAEYGKMVKSV